MVAGRADGEGVGGRFVEIGRLGQPVGGVQLAAGEVARAAVDALYGHVELLIQVQQQVDLRPGEGEGAGAAAEALVAGGQRGEPGVRRRSQGHGDLRPGHAVIQHRAQLAPRHAVEQGLFVALHLLRRRQLEAFAELLVFVGVGGSLGDASPVPTRQRGLTGEFGGGFGFGEAQAGEGRQAFAFVLHPGGEFQTRTLEPGVRVAYGDGTVGRDAGGADAFQGF